MESDVKLAHRTRSEASNMASISQMSTNLLPFRIALNLLLYTKNTINSDKFYVL